MTGDNDNVQGMRDLAACYARELDAQFRTLNFFARHSGEIGRAHEHFLRSVLARFLPEHLRIGTGFAATSKWTSPQQDLMIYSPQSRPLLFQVGDCVVADDEAVRAFIEVKTTLSASELDDYLKKVLDLQQFTRGAKFFGLYAWDGPTLDTALERYWEFTRVNPASRRCDFPHLIYVRGKYLLLNRAEGQWWTPLRVMRLSSSSGQSDGEALLGLLGTLWYALQHEAGWPFWLRDWTEQSTLEPIQWPSDLQAAIQALLPGHPAPSMPV